MKSGFSTSRELEVWALRTSDQSIQDLARRASDNHDQAALQELKHDFDWETDPRNRWRKK